MTITKLNQVSLKADEIKALVDEVMEELNMIVNKNEEVIDSDIKNESETKRKYIRTKLFNNKRNYKEAVIEEVIDGKIVRTMDIDSKTIDGYLNINYFKGRVVENCNSKTGETYLGLVLACYLGSEKEGMYYKPKFNVARFKLINGCLYPDYKDTVLWSVHTCKSQHIGKPIDVKTEVTNF